jgi:3-hydroxyacyl-CoA dehydrogenase
MKIKIEKVAVLGAGEMGHGIAENCAIAGYEVWMGI